MRGQETSKPKRGGYSKGSLETGGGDLQMDIGHMVSVAITSTYISCCIDFTFKV